MAARTDISSAVEQQRRAGRALEALRRRELRGMTDDEALVAAEQLLDLERYLPPRGDGSGLIEQQRLFARARR